MSHATEQEITAKARAKREKRAYFKNNYDLYLFLVPAVIIILIFSYIPIYGVQIAFRDFSARKGIWDSTWVGLEHFQRFFDSANFWPLIWNTLSLSLYSLIAGFPIPIILAIMLNSLKHKRYRKLVQTVTYAPNFISTVVMSGMILLFLSPRIGVVNHLIGMFGINPVNFMGEVTMWRHIYVWSGVWQSAGWGSVIYFAALSGISPELHEAATVDGASKLQRIRHIDIPGILPTATVLLILSCGSILSVGFEKAFLLQNPLNLPVSEIISTYVYSMGLVHNDMSFSSAIGLFNSVINAILLISVNAISRKVSDNSLW
ncbi:MAG: ABC transporter permease subunit [Oscillospiraceae bacterium]